MKLAQFADYIIQGLFNGRDVDGYEAEQKAVELGLLKEVPFDPEKHDDESGYAEVGDTWHELTPEFKAALAAETKT